MPDHASEMEAVIGSAPADLLAYYGAGIFRHPQVARAGKVAVAAIKKKRHNG